MSWTSVGRLRRRSRALQVPVDQRPHAPAAARAAPRRAAAGDRAGSGRAGTIASSSSSQLAGARWRPASGAVVAAGACQPAGGGRRIAAAAASAISRSAASEARSRRCLQPARRSSPGPSVRLGRRLGDSAIEAHLQRARRRTSPPPAASAAIAAGSMIVRFWPSTPTISSSPIFFSEIVALLGERQREPQPRAVLVDLELLGERCRAAPPPGRRSANSSAGEPVEHLGPDHLLLEVRRAQHRHRRERRLHELEMLLLDRAPARRSSRRPRPGTRG